MILGGIYSGLVSLMAWVMDVCPGSMYVRDEDMGQGVTQGVTRSLKSQLKRPAVELLLYLKENDRCIPAKFLPAQNIGIKCFKVLFLYLFFLLFII